MRRAERLFRLVLELRRRDMARAVDLAAALEVSERTIYRDIAHLQASGLPIEGAAGVGYLLRPGFDLPTLTFTHVQLEALAAGAAFIIAAADPELADAAKQARAKIEAVLPSERRAALSAAPYLATRRVSARAPVLMASLRQAIRERTVLALIYCDGAGSVTERAVRPLALTSFTDGWILGAWCELRGALRDFRLDRIEAAKALDRRFKPAASRDLAAYRALHTLSEQSIQSPSAAPSGSLTAGSSCAGLSRNTASRSTA